MAERSECCDRVIVTPEILAEVSHPGCTYGPDRHPFEQCPNRAAWIIDARRRIAAMDRMAPRG